MAITVRRLRRDRGQATVELALCLPLLCLLLLGVVQVSVVVGRQLVVQLAAREGARAAASAADPVAAATAAALRATPLRPLEVSVGGNSTIVTVSVTYRDHTDVALVGTLVPTVALTATVAMAREPP